MSMPRPDEQILDSLREEANFRVSDRLYAEVLAVADENL
jgi:predicted nucleic acid-binding protein